MEVTKEINTDNLYSDLLNRIKLLYSNFKNAKSIVYEYYRRLVLDVSNSMSGKVRKDVLKLIEASKSGIIDLRKELLDYLKKNKKEINKYSFESTFSYVSKIEKVRLSYTKTFLPTINKIIVRLNNLEFADKNKFKKVINKFYFVCNNYIKIIMNDEKSDYVMNFLLQKVKPQN